MPPPTLQLHLNGKKHPIAEGGEDGDTHQGVYLFAGNIVLFTLNAIREITHLPEELKLYGKVVGFEINLP